MLTVKNAADTIAGPVTVVVQLDANHNPFARGLWVGKVRDNSTCLLTGDLSVQNFELVGSSLPRHSAARGVERPPIPPFR